MKRTKHIRWLIVLLILSSLVTSMKADNAAPIGGTNHLEPIVPYDQDGDGYYQKVFRSLLPTKSHRCWMICRPSFKPEYAVAIRDVELPKSGKPADDPFGKLEYRQVLEVATATEQIWHWSQQGDGKLDLRDAQVVCKSAEVSNEFSEEIVNSWKAVLRLTRYADDPDGGLDGTSYDFYAAGYFGATWSPEYTNAALPFSLVNLAHKLKAIVESPAEKRAPLIQEASKMAAALKAAADAEHKRLASISAPAK